MFGILPVLIVMINLSSTPAESLFRSLEDNILRDDNSGKQNSPVQQTTSPTGTLIFNLPIVEQNAPTETPIPEIYPAPGVGLETPSGTPTPTPIPIQTGANNLPIVIGAFAIIFVIVLAWFFIGYLPARNKGEEP
jgi:hypothetical protein